jgi:hypothetical protein
MKSLRGERDTWRGILDIWNPVGISANLNLDIKLEVWSPLTFFIKNNTKMLKEKQIGHNILFFKLL